jgi:hypothetical protein
VNIPAGANPNQVQVFEEILAVLDKLREGEGPLVHRWLHDTTAEWLTPRPAAPVVRHISGMPAYEEPMGKGS